MADVQVQISVQPEVKSFCDPLVQEAKDIKAKAGTATLLADGLPLLMALGSSYQALAGDLKSAETMAYIGFTLGQIAAVFAASVP